VGDPQKNRPEQEEFSILRFDHIAMSGMGTGCGQVRPDIAARAMRAGLEAGLRDMPHRPYSWREARERHLQLKG
jgi:hypothetical protein